MSSNRFKPLGESSRGPAMVASPSPASASSPQPSAQQPPRASSNKKKKGHRAGKKKRSRRKSFAVLDEDDQGGELDQPSGAGDLYKLPEAHLSGTSIDSEALLDHRDHQPMRVRRSSTITGPNPFQNPFASSSASRLRAAQPVDSGDNDSQVIIEDENSPLLAQAAKPSRSRTEPVLASNYGARDIRNSHPTSRRGSSKSSRQRLGNSFGHNDRYDVNHPPSIPGSPTLGAADGIDMSFGDVMIRDEIARHAHSPARSLNGEDAMYVQEDEARRSAPEPPADVCIPGPGMSELGDDEAPLHGGEGRRYHTRRRGGQWPDLSVLEEWKHFEKEGRTDERRVKTITEPQLINGRLRPVRRGWYQTDEDAPYRFTYFNEEFQSTIHSQTISELVQPGGGFKDLFIPEPRVLSDDEMDFDDDDDVDPMSTNGHPRSARADSDSRQSQSTRQQSVAESRQERMASPLKGTTPNNTSGAASGTATPSGAKSPGGSDQKPTQSSGDAPPEKPLRYGDRPVWWLDVLCPTEAEMKVISKAFGIHPLTAEDIMLQEAREKVELFRHYYFVNYRTFDQDHSSENFLEPVNMYVVVFREGVLSFHFSMTPHPANVRRRIRQLTDYLILSSDWISYAIIDDITDVFQPLIQNIEDEVDEIDEAILQLHSSADKRLKDDEKITASKHDDTTTVAESSSDMLRRVGDCRKRVMSLYRLLGNKADVIKGFAKRCNERWEVAPRSEIGLYLGDIQDHIVTMTSNLGHYEKILARSHGNYLAQINIRMNERQEMTADVLGKLTVLGTIVLPMNIITGLWGMNVWVPGQEYEGNLTWFWCITAGLVLFGLTCYITAKRVYRIV